MSEASIRLMADPSGIKSGTETAQKIVEEFSDESVKALQEVTEASEKLKNELKDIAEHSGIPEFAHEVSAAMKQATPQVENLSDEFKKLVVELDRIAEENREAVKATDELTEKQKRHRETVEKLIGVVRDNIVQVGILTAIYVKFGAQLSTIIGVSAKVAGGLKSMLAATTKAGAAVVGASKSVTTFTLVAAKAASTLALVFVPGTTAAAVAISVLTTAMVGTGILLDKTGQKVKALSSNLIAANKVIRENGGDIKKINAALKDMGVTAEEIGIVIETNWTKVKKSTKDLRDEAFNPTYYKRAGQEIAAALKFVADDVGKDFTAAGNEIETAFTRVAKAFQIVIKQRTELGSKVLNNLPGIGADKDSRKEELGGQATQKEAERRDKINKLYEDEHKESLEFERAIERKRQENRIAEIRGIELASTTNHKAIDELLKSHEEVKKNLIAQNQFQGEAAQKWLAQYDKIKQREKEITSDSTERQKIAFEIATTLSQQEKTLEEQRRLSVIAVAEQGTLLSMLEDERELLAEIAEKQEGSIEELNAAKENGLNRVAELEEALEAKRAANIEKENQKEIAAGETRERLLQEHIDRQESVRSAKVAVRNEEALRALKLEGASAERIHDAKMKMIDVETQHLVSMAKTEKEQEEITSNAEIKRINQRAAFRAENEEKTDKQKSTLRELSDAKEDISFRKKLAQLDRESDATHAALEKQGALASKFFDNEENHAKKIFDLRMLHSNELENRELAEEKNADRRADMHFRFELERLKLKADFEIAEADRAEKKKQQLAKNPEPQKVLTHKEQLSALRKSKQEQQATLIAKRNSAKAAKETKLAAAKGKNVGNAKKLAQIAKDQGDRAVNKNFQKGGNAVDQKQADVKDAVAARAKENALRQQEAMKAMQERRAEQAKIAQEAKAQIAMTLKAAQDRHRESKVIASASQKELFRLRILMEGQQADNLTVVKALKKLAGI